MSARNVLLVVLAPFPDEKIRAAVQGRQEVADVTVHVVAPTVRSGTLQWLTGDDHEARAEAEELASRTADALEAKVETEVAIAIPCSQWRTRSARSTPTRSFSPARRTPRSRLRYEISACRSRT